MTPAMNHPCTKSMPSRLATIVLLALLGTTGCVKGIDTTTPGIHGNTHTGPAWMPKAVSMRIYPSTQFVREDGVPLLEARIELFDAMGDSIKGPGNVRCELFASSGRGDGALGERLYGWDIGLHTLADQRAFYDPITRGYLFRLKLDSIAPARQATTLRVAFTPTDGARMSDEAEITAISTGG